MRGIGLQSRVRRIDESVELFTSPAHLHAHCGPNAVTT
jgi:hypothetical protein